MKTKSLLPKVIALLIVVAVIAAVYFSMFYKRCQPISLTKFIAIRIECIGKVNFLDIQAKTCLSLGRDSQCQISYDNLKEDAALREEFNKEISACIASSIEKKNYCEVNFN